jgi:hypothetical protein
MTTASRDTTGRSLMLTRFGKFSLTLGKLTLQIGHELLTCWRASSLIFADLAGTDVPGESYRDRHATTGY